MTAPIDNALSRLEKVRQRAPGQWSARCPAHADKGPSLSLRESPEGAVLLHCFAGCNTQAVVSAMGLELADLFPPRSTSGREPKRLARLLTPSQALELLDFEASLVVVAAGNVAHGAVLSPTDRERIAKAASRISWLRQEASSLVGASHA